MPPLEPQLSRLAEEIQTLEKQRHLLCSCIKKVKNTLQLPADSDILEQSLVFKVLPSKLENHLISAVDGGIVQARYHGLNLIVCRAAAVLFNFKKGALLETTYYPNSIPSPETISYLTPISEQEYSVSASIERLKREIKTAAEAVEKFSPSLMLLDGSVVPHRMDRPAQDSKIYESYSELIALYSKLYETCENKNTMLAGVVEDSSGMRLCGLFEDKVIPELLKNNSDAGIGQSLNRANGILKKTNDSNLLYHVLDVGERTCIYSYSKKPEKNTILRDLGKWKTQINSFYLKSVEFDRPTRIDFLGAKSETAETASKIAEIVYALSRHNETYAWPSILIEADARARLSERDLELVYSGLKDKLGDVPSLFKLRRELRPF